MAPERVLHRRKSNAQMHWENNAMDNVVFKDLSLISSGHIHIAKIFVSSHTREVWDFR